MLKNKIVAMLFIGDKNLMTNIIKLMNYLIIKLMIKKYVKNSLFIPIFLFKG